MALRTAAPSALQGFEGSLEAIADWAGVAVVPRDAWAAAVGLPEGKLNPTTQSFVAAEITEAERC